MKNKYVNRFVRQVSKHAPEIFTGIGIAGMLATVVLAVRATPKAEKLIAEEKECRKEELDAVDVVKAAWRPYVPAAITGSLSIVCLIGGCSVNCRRNAALASAANMSAMALKDFRESATEVVGEKKVKEIDEKISEKKLSENPVSQTVVYAGPGGKSLFYDELSNQYFETDLETIRSVINDLNWQLGYGSEVYASLSEFYDLLSDRIGVRLKHTPFSDMIGWNIRDGNIEPNFTTMFADDGRPCGVISFTVMPTYGFDDLNG